MSKDWIDLDSTDLDTELERAAAREELSLISPTGFPLKTLLYFFVTGPTEIRMDYYAGFKYLHHWLKPICIPVVPSKRVPFYLHNWEVQELAQIIGCSHSIIWYTLLEIFNETERDDVNYCTY